ncbi:MAG: excinuclease ABC subunit C [Polyangiaceae bacterium]|nr:excinuclease ABC subunit C [Polyangiaceae bacterium]
MPRKRPRPSAAAPPFPTGPAAGAESAATNAELAAGAESAATSTEPTAGVETDLIARKLAQLPASPGCYVFRDRSGAALYVGKAKSLRSRVRSYFQEGGGDQRAFIPFLRRHATDLETIVTASEKEAAILENSLIKETRPKYNFKLRDDKEFLTLRLAEGHEWPRLELVRKPRPDGARYFGPYHSATAARRTLHLVEKHFQLRTCSDRELAGRRRPCLQYQIQRCPAPCALPIEREVYAAQVRAVALFLDGRHDELTAELSRQMAAAAAAMEYERAGKIRDQLAAVRVVQEQQRVVAVADRDQDVLGLYREADLVELGVLYVRRGRVVDAATFSSKGVELPNDEVVAAFLRDHYGEHGLGGELIPDEVLVPVLPEGADGVADWLSERRVAVAVARHEARGIGEAPGRGERRGRCVLLAPARGPRRELVDLAAENARHAFAEKARAAEDIDQRLARLQARLRLPTLPRRIECVDISHLGGKDTVGAVVVLTDGVADKRRYRTYRVKNAAEGDDYAAMLEVLSRRFRRGKAASDPEEDEVGMTIDEDGVVLEDAGATARADAAKDSCAAVARDPVADAARPEASLADWELPDLFVVDGGRGQLAVARTAAQDLGLFELPIVGLAKERETPLGDKIVDRVYLPGQKNPVSLRPNSPELFLLARARDEAHRFANRGRLQVGKARTLGSELDRVHGIGTKTRNALLTALGSVESVRGASDEAILAVPGVTRAQLRALRAHFAVGAASEEDERVPEG